MRFGQVISVFCQKYTPAQYMYMAAGEASSAYGQNNQPIAAST